MVPSALETCVKETSLVRVLSSFSYSSSRIWPSVVDGDNAQDCALFGGQHLPGNDVGVVLDPADDDLVALVDVLASPALGNQVDGLGGAADEHDLLGRRRVEEVRDLGASILVGVGGAGGKFVGGAVDVGVLVLVEVFQAVDDGLRLLRGGGVVEPDQRTAIDLLAQDGKVVANGGDIELATDGADLGNDGRREALGGLRGGCDGLREGSGVFEKIER
jgi:hypothetical protein